MRIKFLKNYEEHKKGDVVTPANDADAQKYIDFGIAEKTADPNPLEGLGEMIAKGVRDGLGQLSANSTSKGLQFSGRIDGGLSEAEKTMSFGDQLVQIGIVCNHESTPRQIEESANRLEKCYKSKYREWDTKASATMVENTGTNGGYGVFPEYTQEIFRIAIEGTIIASRARKRPMSGNVLYYPKLDQTDTRATNQTGYLGGVVAGWANETKSGNQTSAKLKQGILKTGELVGYTVVTNELLADNAIGLEAILKELFAEAVGYYTDLATLVGDGVDKPVGVVGAPATLVTGPNAGSRTTASKVVYEDLVWLKSKLLPGSLKTARFIFNQTVMNELYLLKDGSNRNIWLPNFPGGDRGPVSGTGAPTVLDLPYDFTEKTPVLGVTGDVMLVDPMGYLLGERMGLEVAASPHVNFLNREMTYRFVARIGGQPLLDKPFTMIDGTNQLSTFVALKGT